MAVTKRQRREKPTKIEQRMVQGIEWGPQAKQTAVLTSPIYIGQAQEEEKQRKTYKKRNKNWIGGLLFSSHILGQPALRTQDVFSSAF